jgi:hypothetical protein
MYEIAPQSRDILRQYKALINARRRDAGQRELTTAQVMDEICEYGDLASVPYIPAVISSFRVKGQ